MPASRADQAELSAPAAPPAMPAPAMPAASIQAPTLSAPATAGAAPAAKAASASESRARERDAALADDAAWRNDPQRWLAEIRRLKAAGQSAAVARELATFRRAHPAHVVPAELTQ
jgi:hypothetical protein